MKVMMVWPPKQAYPEAVFEVRPSSQTMDLIQTIVGGYAAQVPLSGYRFIMEEGDEEPTLKIMSAWVDEDGLPKALHPNLAASRYFGTHLVGHVAIIAELIE